MITSGLSAQLPAGGLSAGEAKSAEAVAEHMLKVGMVNVEEQFAEMAIGVREQFDLAGVALAMGSAGLSAELGAKLKVDNPWVQRSLTDIGTAAMSGVVRGQFDMESLATQLIADNVGVMVQQMKTPSKLEEAYHQSQQASRGRNANDIDQQWQTEFINDAKLAANTPLPSITFDVEDPWTAAQLGQQVGEAVSRFEHVDLPRNPNGFWQRVERSYENVFEHRALIAEGRAAANSESMRESLAGATSNEQNYLDLGYSESVVETRVAEWMAPVVLSAAPPVIRAAAAAAKAYSLANKWGFFGHNGVEEPLSLLGNEASNHINALRLQRSFTIEQAKSIFDDAGGLLPEVIQKSIRLDIEFKNTELKEMLSTQAGNLSDWRKYITESVPSPSGNFRMHFYHNPVTGDVYYGMDYKAVFNHDGSWKLPLLPNFEYKPPHFTL